MRAAERKGIPTTLRFLVTLIIVEFRKWILSCLNTAPEYKDVLRKPFHLSIDLLEEVVPSFKDQLTRKRKQRGVNEVLDRLLRPPTYYDSKARYVAYFTFLSTIISECFGGAMSTAFESLLKLEMVKSHWVLPVVFTRKPTFRDCILTYNIRHPYLGLPVTEFYGTQELIPEQAIRSVKQDFEPSEEGIEIWERFQSQWETEIKTSMKRFEL